jgi:hypothetical protein
MNPEWDDLSLILDGSWRLPRPPSSGLQWPTVLLEFVTEVGDCQALLCRARNDRPCFGIRNGSWGLPRPPSSGSQWPTVLLEFVPGVKPNQIKLTVIARSEATKQSHGIGRHLIK